MNEYKSRIERLLSQLPEDADGALVTSQVSRLYLTGYDADTGFLIVTRNGCEFITDFRYIEAAAARLEGVCAAEKYVKFDETLKEVCARLGAERLLIERDRLTISEGLRLSAAAKPVVLVESSALDDALNAMRVGKSLTELDKIRRAQDVTERSYRRVLELIREGVTERELALALEFDMRKSGASRVAFDLIVAGGANGSMPHAVPSDYRIQKGDFITFDIGAVVDGYHSDMTRTVAFGDVTREQAEVYDIVLKAQKAGIEYLMAGNDNCFEADKTARDVICAAGYGDCFGHSTGHGVGLEIHEAPSLSPTGKATMSEGCVVTVEPGIYIAGRFGVRIEDMLYITEGSAIDLTGVEKELIVIN